MIVWQLRQNAKRHFYANNFVHGPVHSNLSSEGNAQSWPFFIVVMVQPVDIFALKGCPPTVDCVLNESGNSKFLTVKNRLNQTRI